MPVSLSRRRLSTLLKTEERSPHYFYTSDGWKEMNLTGTPTQRPKESGEVDQISNSGRTMPRISKPSIHLPSQSILIKRDCNDAIQSSEMKKDDKTEQEEQEEELGGVEEFAHPVCDFLEAVKRAAAEAVISHSLKEETYEESAVNEEKIGDEEVRTTEDTEDFLPTRRLRNRPRHHRVEGIRQVYVDPPPEPPIEIPCKDEWNNFREAVHTAIEQMNACNEAQEMKSLRCKQWSEYVAQKEEEQIMIIQARSKADSLIRLSMLSDNEELELEEFEPSGSMVTQAGSLPRLASYKPIEPIPSNLLIDAIQDVAQDGSQAATVRSEIKDEYHVVLEPCSISVHDEIPEDKIPGDMESGSYIKKMESLDVNSSAGSDFLNDKSSSTSMTTMAGSRGSLSASISFDQSYDYYREGSYDRIMQMPIYGSFYEEMFESEITEATAEHDFNAAEEDEGEGEGKDKNVLKKGVSDSGSFYHAASDMQDFLIPGEESTASLKPSTPSASIKTKTRKESYFERLKGKFKFFTQDDDGVIILIPKEEIDESYKEDLKKYYHVCKHKHGLKLLKRKDDSSSLGESQDEHTLSDQEDSADKLSPFAKCVTEIDALRKQQSEIRRQKVAEIIEQDKQYKIDNVTDYADDVFGEGDDLYSYKMEMIMMDDYICTMPEYESDDFAKTEPSNISNIYEQCLNVADYTISDQTLQEPDFDKYHSQYTLADMEPKTNPEEQWKNKIYLKVIEYLLMRTVNVKGREMKIKDVLGPEKVNELFQFKMRGLAVSRDVKTDSEDYFRAMDLKDLRSEAFGEDADEDCNTEKVVISKNWYSLDKHAVMDQLLETMVDDILNGPKPSNAKKMFNILEIAAEIERSKTKFDSQMPDKNIITYKEKTVTLNDEEKGVKEHKVNKEFAIVGAPSEEEETDDTEIGDNDLQEKEASTEKIIHPFQMIETKGPIKFPSGAKYFGNWNKIGMESCGVYQTPDGILIECKMKDGLFDGDTKVTFPNGTVIRGTYIKNEFYPSSYTFKDGLTFESSNWKYLQWPDRRFWSEIVNNIEGREQASNDLPTRKIPKGCIETGEGFYCPQTKYIHHPRTLKPIRIPSEEEEERIMLAYRRGWRECVSHSHHLYEHGLKTLTTSIKYPYSSKPEKAKRSNKQEVKQDEIRLDKKLSLKPANPSGQEILNSITSIFSPGPEGADQFRLSEKWAPTQKLLRQQLVQKRENNMRKFKGLCYNAFANCKLQNQCK